MEFEYKKSRISADLIFGVLFLIITVFIVVMILRKLILDWDEIKISNLIFITGFILILAVQNYQFLGIAMIRNSYYQLNLRQEVKLDIQNRKIILINKNNNTEKQIDFSKVKSIELYYSWNTASVSSDLGFSKIDLENSEKPIIVTQNNINQYHIFEAFKDKVIKSESRYANRLKVKIENDSNS
ncbi:MAG: hypothetical protein WBF83_07785 [Moheibacter sp.]